MRFGTGDFRRHEVVLMSGLEVKHFGFEYSQRRRRTWRERVARGRDQKLSPLVRFAYLCARYVLLSYSFLGLGLGLVGAMSSAMHFAVRSMWAKSAHNRSASHTSSTVLITVPSINSTPTIQLYVCVALKAPSDSGRNSRIARSPYSVVESAVISFSVKLYP
jgi:hypothetical protein